MYSSIRDIFSNTYLRRSLNETKQQPEWQKAEHFDHREPKPRWVPLPVHARPSVAGNMEPKSIGTLAWDFDNDNLIFASMILIK